MDPFPVLEEMLDLIAKYCRQALGRLSLLDVPYLKAYVCLQDRRFKELGEELQGEQLSKSGYDFWPSD